MKPVKEIALMLDVSSVTVYNHIKKIKKDIKANIFNVKGATYLDDEGIRQLKISMGLLQVPEVKENISIENIIDEISNQIVKDTNKKYDDLQEDIKSNNERLEKELNEIKEQNKMLLDLLQVKQDKTLLEKFKNIFRKEV